MATFEIANLYIYRLRYVIGYGLVGMLLVGLLIFAGLFLPGGLSLEEMTAVIKSDTITLTNFSSFAIQNLPYHLLQSISIDVFGVSNFSIKLPSLILGLFSALGIIFLMGRWFKRNIAVLGSLIAISSSQFLFVAQSGTPGILYIFWPVMLLLLGTLVTRGKRLRFLWKILFFAAAALSLYTPLSVYPLIAILLAVIFHPHLRNIVRNLSKPHLVLAIIFSVIVLSPLVWGVVRDPSLGLALLGIPPDFPNLITNIVTLGKQYVGFWKPSTTTLMTPVFGLGSVLLILYGLYHLIKTREATQSYLVIAWLLCLIPVLIINPDFTSVMFIPLVLLLTAGLHRLVSYWYRLFPRNPYARFAGLVPLVILVLALISSGVERYAYGYYYSPQTAQNFSRDLTLLPKNTAGLIVSDSERPFYSVVAGHRDGIQVLEAPAGDAFTVTRAAKHSFEGYAIDRIVTSYSSSDSDRFYIYKKISE